MSGSKNDPFMILREVTSAGGGGKLWPVMAPPDGDDGMLITREPADGEDVTAIPIQDFSLLWVADANERTLAQGDAQGHLYVTASRVALACKNYKKSLKMGTDVVRLGLTTTLSGKAYHRLRGRDSILAGHVRYEWLASVSACPERGQSGAKMRFGCKAGLPWSSRKLVLEVTPSAPVAAMEGAAEVIRRAARFKLAGNIEDDTREELATLTQLPLLEPPATQKEFTTCEMPVFTFVPG